MTFLKKSIAFSLLAILAGCSMTPNEPAVTAQDYKQSFTGYDLSETNHSEAMPSYAFTFSPSYSER